MRPTPLVFALLLVTACESKSRLPMGQVTEGTLNEGDAVTLEGPYADRWTFSGDEGQRVRIEMRSSQFDALLRLQGPDGQVLTSNDDALGRDAAITIRLPEGGRYTILATSYGSERSVGLYRIVINPVTGTFADPGAVGRIDAGANVEGVLEVGDSTKDGGGFVDYFNVRPAASGTVVFDLVSEQFDTYLSLLDSTGAVVATDDDSGDGNNARLTYGVSAGAAYRLAATTYGGGARSGVYRLTARAGPPQLK